MLVNVRPNCDKKNNMYSNCDLPKLIIDALWPLQSGKSAKS